MFKNIREYENLHIALWLIKDTCWVMGWSIGGMLMIVPTLFVAIHITWRSRRDLADLFHNVAVCCWISANAIWMTGEFFFQDGLRNYAMIFFTIGLVVVAIFYIVHFPEIKRKQRAAEDELKARKPE
ncbi:MAG: hypothetical protein U0T74_15505 [Chitinophagales bacterium]